MLAATVFLKNLDSFSLGSLLCLLLVCLLALGALSDGINALVEGFFALLMGEVFGIGLKLKESKKSDTL